MYERLGVVASVGIALLQWGCVRTIPPPVTPDRVVPSVEGRALEEGEGRVILDVTDGPTEVYHRLSTETVVGMDKDRPIVETEFSTELVCTTPCSIAGPIGRYELLFPARGGGHFDTATVDIRAEPTVYRRSLGSYQGGGAGLPLGIVSATFGGMSLVCGAVFLPLGLTRDEGEGGGLVIAGAVTLIAGAILTALGVWGITTSAVIEQPGADIQFQLPSVEASATVQSTAP